MLGNIRFGNIVSNATTNATRVFECHPGGEEHGKILLGIAGAGVVANLSIAGLMMARKSLRRWSSGLLIHGTIVDGTRSALLVPLALSVLKCAPVTRCSILDTVFLLLATVTSLNLLTASLSDAPLLPATVIVPTILQSAGVPVSQSASGLYHGSGGGNGGHSSYYYHGGGSNGFKGGGGTLGFGRAEPPMTYYPDYYEEDANLLAEKTAMPDSPQCVLFGSFMVWFAALTINLGPTFLSGAIAAHAEATPLSPSCPLVRGPNRHVILNILWAAVNLLCVALAASHLRKLKKDLARARLGLLAAAGAGLAGMTGLATNVNTNPSHPSTTSTSLLSNVQPSNSNLSKVPPLNRSNPSTSSSTALPPLPTLPSSSSSSKSKSKGHGHGGGGSSTTTPGIRKSRTTVTPSELEVFLRQAQRNSHSHIRTLGTLAILNLTCWVPLYVTSLIRPVGKSIWEDPVQNAYEWSLMMAFTHSILHPIFLLFLHGPLRNGVKRCFWETFCCLCICFGMELNFSSSSSEDSGEAEGGGGTRAPTPDYEDEQVGLGGGLNEVIPRRPHSSSLHNSIELSQGRGGGGFVSCRERSFEENIVSHPSSSTHRSYPKSGRGGVPSGPLPGSSRTGSLKSNQSLSGVVVGPGGTPPPPRPHHHHSHNSLVVYSGDELDLPPPPLPPSFRKQVSLGERSSPPPPRLPENRW